MPKAYIIHRRWISYRRYITRSARNGYHWKTTSFDRNLSFFMVGDGGFGPPKSVTTDLQSAPFGRSGNPPYGAGDRSRTNNLLITNQLLCHWATPAYFETFRRDFLCRTLILYHLGRVLSSVFLKKVSKNLFLGFFHKFPLFIFPFCIDFIPKHVKNELGDS